MCAVLFPHTGFCQVALSPDQSFPRLPIHMVTGQRSRTTVTTACRVVPATTSTTTSPVAGV